MLKALFVIMIAAVMLAPTQVDGYGAAHYNYTRVTPSGGVQHYSATAVRTPYGGTSVSHTATGYGGASGGAYHAGYGGAYGGAAYGGYHYTGAAATGGSYHYAYVR